MAKNTPTESKTKQAQAAKQMADEIKAREAKRARTSRIIMGVVIVAVIAVVVGIVAFFSQQSNSNVQSKTSSKASASSQYSDDPSVPLAGTPLSIVNELSGVLYSKNGIGKEIKSIPTVDSYVSFICPFCGMMERDIANSMMKLVDEGKINWVIHPTGAQFMERFAKGDNYPTRAASAAIFVAEHEPENFFNFVEYLFKADIQPGEGNEFKRPDDKQIAKWAVASGVSEKVANDPKLISQYYTWAQKTADIAMEKTGMTGLPGVFIKLPDMTAAKQVNWSTLLPEGTYDMTKLGEVTGTRGNVREATPEELLNIITDKSKWKDVPKS